MPDLVIACPVSLRDVYCVPADDTVWDTLNYLQLGSQGQTPHRPRATFASHTNALDPIPQVPNFDTRFGVYMLAVCHPHKAFYVGIAAADGQAPEGIGSRVRKHRVKLTASHVGPTRDCGSPTGTGGVHHPGRWRQFALARYQFHLSPLADDLCDDVRMVVGTAGGNAGETLEEYEAAILHNEGGIRSRLFDILWPGEDNSNVFILNTIRGRAPDELPGAIILPADCPELGAAIRYTEV